MHDPRSVRRNVGIGFRGECRYPHTGACTPRIQPNSLPEYLADRDCYSQLESDARAVGIRPGYHGRSLHCVNS